MTEYLPKNVIIVTENHKHPITIIIRFIKETLFTQSVFLRPPTVFLITRGLTKIIQHKIVQNTSTQTSKISMILQKQFAFFTHILVSLRKMEQRVNFVKKLEKCQFLAMYKLMLFMSTQIASVLLEFNNSSKFKGNS